MNAKSVVLNHLFVLSILLVLRLLFLGMNIDDLSEFTFMTLTRVLMVGSIIDSFILSIMTFMSYLITTICSHVFKKPMQKMSILISVGATLTMTFVSIVDIFYYRQFGSRLNALALSIADDPATLIPTIVKTLPVFPVFMITTVLAWAIYKVNILILRLSGTFYKQTWKTHFSLVLTISVLSFAYIKEPLWHLTAAFGKESLNQSANNGIYSLVQSTYTNFILDQVAKTKNIKIDIDKVYSVMKNAILKDDEVDLSTPQMPTLRKIKDSSARFSPKNVVIVLLESFGASKTFLQPSVPSFSPNFERVSKDGVLMTSCFSNGPRTQHGIFSSVSGFPAILGVNIIRRRSVNEFDTLGNLLEKKGYHTQFLHGGKPEYDDMEIFFKQSAFKFIMGVNDFTAWRMKNEWGVSDEDLFEKVEPMLWGDSSRPALSVILSMSNHSPWDLPHDFVNNHPEVKSMTLRQAGHYYSDFAFGQFMDRIKRHPKYRDTLFVVLGDHGEAELDQEREFNFLHIPVLFLNTSEKPGLRQQVCSQSDIATTILHQLSYDLPFHFIGQNLFAPDYRPFALTRNYENYFYVNNNRVIKFNPEKDLFQIYQVKQDWFLDSKEEFPMEVSDDEKEFPLIFYKGLNTIFKNGYYHLRH